MRHWARDYGNQNLLHNKAQSNIFSIEFKFQANRPYQLVFTEVKKRAKTPSQNTSLFACISLMGWTQIIPLNTKFIFNFSIEKLEAWLYTKKFYFNV